MIGGGCNGVARDTRSIVESRHRCSSSVVDWLPGERLAFNEHSEKQQGARPIKHDDVNTSSAWLQPPHQ